MGEKKLINDKTKKVLNKTGNVNTNTNQGGNVHVTLPQYHRKITT